MKLELSVKNPKNILPIVYASINAQGNIIGKKFIVSNRKFEVVDYKARNHKMPVIAVEEGKPDRRYKFNADILKQLL